MAGETPEFDASMSDHQVVDALVAAQGDNTPTAADTQAREIAARHSEQVETAAPESDGTEEQPDAAQAIEDSFSGLNPADLPPEARPYYDSMLADYRRKTQGIAEQGRQFEALEEYGGVDTAVQALEWLSSLQNPENALELHRELTDALVEQGYEVGEAKQEATRQVQQAAEEETDEFAFEGGRDPRVDELQSKITELEKYREEEQGRNLQLALAAEYDRQEAQIIRENPKYTDDDVENLYRLSFAEGGSLVKANEAYQGIQSHLLGRYLEEKGKPVGGGPLPSSGPADTPTSFKSLDEPGLEKAVNEFLAQQQAGE